MKTVLGGLLFLFVALPMMWLVLWAMQPNRRFIYSPAIRAD